MIKTAFRFFVSSVSFVPFLASIAACSSSAPANNHSSDGGIVAANLACPDHCTRDTSRDSACTTMSNVGERFGCKCDDQAPMFFDNADCETDLGLDGGLHARNICCNPSPKPAPAGGACDTAQDCETVTCANGGKASGCLNGICAGAENVCGH